MNLSLSSFVASTKKLKVQKFTKKNKQKRKNRTEKNLINECNFSAPRSYIKKSKQTNKTSNCRIRIQVIPGFSYFFSQNPRSIPGVF